MAAILCIEDSQEFQILLSSALREHSLTCVGTLSEGLQLLTSRPNHYELVLLDISLPDGNSIKELPQIRQLLGDRMVPIIAISSDKDTLTKVAAFGIGVDDYIEKPPNIIELRARIDAKIRWAQSSSQLKAVLKFEDLELDTQKIVVQLHSKEHGLQTIDLTPIEFKILRLFISHPAQVFSRDQIIDRIWGFGHNVTPRTIDAHISHLRTKLEKSQAIIETVLTEGYKISKKP